MGAQFSEVWSYPAVNFIGPPVSCTRVVEHLLNPSPNDELGNWCYPRLVAGPHANTRRSREVPWQPCEQEPALQVATKQHHHTEGTSVEKLT